jgi:hypothetical protein
MISRILTFTAALLLTAAAAAVAQDLRAFYSAVSAPQPGLQSMNGGTFQFTASPFEHIGIRLGFSVATGGASAQETMCDSYWPEATGCESELTTRRTEYGAVTLGLVAFSPPVSGFRALAGVSMVRSDLNITRSGRTTLRSEQPIMEGLPAGGTEWTLGAEYAVPRFTGLSVAAEYAWTRFSMGACVMDSWSVCGPARPNQLRLGAAFRVGRFTP